MVHFFLPRVPSKCWICWRFYLAAATTGALREAVPINMYLRRGGDIGENLVY
jgi:hypothetical protein